MAGVTIAALTGSDSAPSKANEAKQKNDIGAAKDDVSLAVTNAITEAYQTAYVETGVSAGNASTTVGTSVRTKINQKYGTDGNYKIGLATITATATGSIEITTTDFILEGEIAAQGGQLTWGEIDENKPGIRFNISSSITITEGEQQDVTATLKQFTADTVTWTSSNPAKATVTAKTDTKQATIKGIAKTATDSNETVTITASAGGYSATIKVKVEEEQLELISSKKGQGILSKLTDANPHSTKLKDAKGNTMVVPAGFEISSSNGAAANVAEGIIIEDGNKDANGNGNQFVWVPIGIITKADGTSVEIPLGRYSTFKLQNSKYQPVQNVSNGYVTTTSSHVINSYCYEFAQKQTTDTGDSESVTITKALNDPNYPNGYETENTKARNIQEFVASAIANKGFYIARYEAGINGTASSNTDATQGGLTKDSETSGYIVSKAGVGVWNKIRQPYAATVCQNMYTEATNKYVTSDLVNSYAWDTAIIFIQQCGTKTNSGSYYNQSGQAKSGSIGTTGTNPLNSPNVVDEQCNIYDMAGNVREWTTESYAYTGYPCVRRGGDYYNTTTTSDRNCSSTTDTLNNIGFRPLLYL